MSDSTKFCTVLERKDMGDGTEVVLCDRGAEHLGRYVSWVRDLDNGATYHGHYNTQLKLAVEKYEERTRHGRIYK